MQESCVFCRIVAGTIPARLAYEDDSTLAFHDTDPRAPVHVLVVPREHIGGVNHLEPGDAQLAGRLLLTARQVAQQLGVADSGYRLVINSGGHGGQTVDHIHLHIMGGRPMTWPPG
jgi:histidine triad (HIT) family protein